jgi:F-type H+-transporting ATPase subunit epsilon
MQLEILTPEHKIYSGNVYGIQLPGIEGSFEVLENHAPMIASLASGKMKILKDKNNNTELYQISGGFAEVINNKVSVLIEDANALA